MAKKPVKIILKFSNNSSTKEKPKKGKGKKSGPCGEDSPRNHRGPSKLKS